MVVALLFILPKLPHYGIAIKYRPCLATVLLELHIWWSSHRLSCYLWRGRRTEEKKDGEIICNATPYTQKSWPPNSSFARFLPVTGQDVPLSITSSPWSPVFSRPYERFTDWWYSAEHRTAAGSRQAMANRSQESAWFQTHLFLPGVKAGKLVVWLSLSAHIPLQITWPTLKPIHSSLASEGPAFKRVLFVTSL